jgi:hypothetical protein
MRSRNPPCTSTLTLVVSFSYQLAALSGSCQPPHWARARNAGRGSTQKDGDFEWRITTYWQRGSREPETASLANSTYG